MQRFKCLLTGCQVGALFGKTRQSRFQRSPDKADPESAGVLCRCKSALFFKVKQMGMGSQTAWNWPSGR